MPRQATTLMKRPHGTWEEIVGRAPKSVVLALKVVFVGIVSFAQHRDRFRAKVPPHNISVLWPTTSILFAVLVAAPVRDWWAYSFAAYFTSIVNDAHAGFPISGMLFLVAGLVNASIAAVGVRRFAGGVRSFDSLWGLITYIIFAVVLAPLVSASVAAFAGATQDYWFFWRVWFLSEGLGYLMLAPVLLTWFGAARAPSHKVSFARFMEACLIACGLFAVCIPSSRRSIHLKSASQPWFICRSHSFSGPRCGLAPLE